MRRYGSLLVVLVVVGVVVLGSTALLAGPRPSGCAPCGKEFKNVQPSSCGIAENPVDGYRANGDLVAVFSSRCHACTTKGVFCTVGPR